MVSSAIWENEHARVGFQNMFEICNQHVVFDVFAAR